MVQVFITIGLCMGYFMCYDTTRITSSMSWRFPLAVEAGIALFLAIAASVYLPESPRWLAYRKRNQKAISTWETLGVPEAEREKDLLATTRTEPNVAAEPAGITGGK